MIRPAAIASSFLLGSCDGPLSALAPASPDAQRIAEIFWWMAGGAALVWALVLGIALYAALGRERKHEREKMRLFIVGGGALFPTVVLSVLLVYGLGAMPALLEAGSEDGPRIRVAGEQWWWRVRYELPDGTQFDTANEIRLPVGHRAPLRLVSPDVIHSLWVPSLGGKKDLIPGRVNRMALEPSRPGVFRGLCAEYCGTSHAKMMLHAVALEPDEFEAWAAAQADPARPPSGRLAERGAELFASLGCGACHTIRGTDADGVLGPDLTHVGSRLAVGAGILDNDVDGFERWLAQTDVVKPDVHMPSFGMLADDELHALATFLEGLR